MILSYDIWVTRAHALDQARHFPISMREWLTVADADPDLRLSRDDFLDRVSDAGEPERVHPWLIISLPGEPPLWFMDGAVQTTNADQPVVAKLVQLALKLRAQVLDENGGNRYGADGAWVP